MKKVYTLTMIALLLSLSLMACGNSAASPAQSNQTSSQAQASSQQPKETVIAPAKTGSTYLDGLNKVDEFAFQQDGKDITVTLYTDAELDSAGEPMLDDMQEWALVAAVGGKLYPLVPRSKLQLGAVNYDIFDDRTNTAHILACVKTGASLKTYDFSYRADSADFISHDIYGQENINLMHSK